MPLYLIVNIAHLEDHGFTGMNIPQHMQPTYLHTEREAAEMELVRLQAKIPAGQFVLFASVAEMRPVSVGEAFIMESIGEHHE